MVLYDPVTGQYILLPFLSIFQFKKMQCKNVEKVNVWEAYEQAKGNAKNGEPLVIIKRNKSKPLALVDAEYFVKLHRPNNVEDL